LWGPVAALMAVIFALSARPTLPMPPGFNDKGAHLLAYAALATLTLRATAGGRLAGVSARSLLAAWVVATLYGATDEFHQTFVPGRSADVLDLVADSAGAALAATAWGAFGIIVRSRGRQRAG